MHKLATNSYHPNCNGDVERVNHTIAQMLAMVVNQRLADWDLHLPHVEFAYNNSVSAATGLAPTRSTWADSHGSPWRFLTALASWDTRV